MPTYSQHGVDGPHAENWNRWLGKFKGRPCTAIEVGSWEGRSARWFLDNILTNEQSRLVCIDTWEGGEEHRANGIDCSVTWPNFKSNMAEYGGKVLPIKGRSEDGLRKAFCFRADFIYIDGSHMAADVLSDSVLAWPLLKDSGVLIFDDYRWEFKGALSEPMIAIDAFLQCYRGRYNLLGIGYQVAIEKIGCTQQ